MRRLPPPYNAAAVVAGERNLRREPHVSDVISVSQLAAPPARPDDSHKGTFGTVVVVGG